MNTVDKRIDKAPIPYESLKTKARYIALGAADEYLKKNRLEFREAVSSRSEYYRTTEGDWAVRCRVMEHTTALIDMTLIVPNETQAKVVSREWKEKCQEIYALVIRRLTQPDHIDRIVEEDTGSSGEADTPSAALP